MHKYSKLKQLRHSAFGHSTTRIRCQLCSCTRKPSSDSIFDMCTAENAVRLFSI